MPLVFPDPIINNLLGWSTFVIIVLIMLLVFNKQNLQVKNILIFAFILRLTCVIIDEYFFVLPGSDMDAFAFEWIAYQYSLKYKLDKISQLFQWDSYFLAKFISIIYTLLDRSPIMANMFSLGLGTATVFLIYRLAFIIWGKRAALQAGWISAVFPTLVLYSSILMRETYVIFFLSYTLIKCVNCINSNNKSDFIKSVLGFCVVSLFHAPMILGLFIFLIFIFFQILKRNNYFIHFKKKNLPHVFILPIILVPFIAFYLGLFSIPKIGNLKNFGDLDRNAKEIVDISKLSIIDRLLWKIKKSTRSTDLSSYSIESGEGAKYPKWTVPNNGIELIYLTPVRIFYFLYSPFPWDIKNFNHLMGAFDSIFYIYLSFCILRNHKNLQKKPEIKFLITIFLMYTLVYSFGVGNFGTAIRHRLKFLSLLIVIAAPKIAKLKFFKKE